MVVIVELFQTFSDTSAAMLQVKIFMIFSENEIIHFIICQHFAQFYEIYWTNFHFIWIFGFFFDNIHDPRSDEFVNREIIKCIKVERHFK